MKWIKLSLYAKFELFFQFISFIFLVLACIIVIKSPALLAEKANVLIPIFLAVLFLRINIEFKLRYESVKDILKEMRSDRRNMTLKLLEFEKRVKLLEKLSPINITILAFLLGFIFLSLQHLGR